MTALTVDVFLVLRGRAQPEERSDASCRHGLNRILPYCPTWKNSSSETGEYL